MPVETRTKAKQETWRDWAPDAPEPEPNTLLTREELLDRLSREGLATTGNQLRYWQSAGLIPYPIKRRIGQAVYAYYPPWIIRLVGVLRQLQGRRTGAKLAAMRPTLRTVAKELAADEEMFVVFHPQNLAKRLVAIAEEFQSMLGLRQGFTHVEVRLTDRHGHPLVFAAPLPPDEDTA